MEIPKESPIKIERFLRVPLHIDRDSYGEREREIESPENSPKGKRFPI